MKWLAFIFRGAFRHTALLLFFGALGLSLLLGNLRNTSKHKAASTLNAREALYANEDLLMQVMDSVLEDVLQNAESKLKVQTQAELAFFVYKNDSLIYWNSASVPVPFQRFDEEFLQPVMQLRNGWYRILRRDSADVSIVGMVKIKQEFFIKNEFLQDAFSPGFGFDNQVQISLNPADSDFHLADRQGYFLCALVFPQSERAPLRFPLLAGLTYFLALLLGLYLLYDLRRLRVFRKRPAMHLSLFALFVVAVRIINIQFKFPFVLYELPLFSPLYFASSDWLPSLGDFMVHALLMTALLALIFSNYSKYKYPDVQGSRLTLWILIFGGMVAGFSYALLHLLRTLVFDSSISFDLFNVLELNTYSFWGFTLLALLLANFLLISHFCSKMLARSPHLRWWKAALWTLVPYAGMSLITLFLDGLDPLSIWLTYPIHLAILWVHMKNKQVIGFYSLAPTLILFAGYATFMLSQLNTEKELQARQVLALKIAEEQDHVAEFLFDQAVKGIQSDAAIRYFLQEYSYSFPYEFFERIAQRYFGGYWSKYALVIVPFSSREVELYATHPELADPDVLHYEASIEKQGRATASPYLFYLENNYGKVNYLGRIPVSVWNGKDTSHHFIYLEFISKMVTQVTGFPELLLDQSITRPVNLKGYSYASYKEGELNVAAGDFAYPLQSERWNTDTNQISLRRFKGFSHLLLRQSPANIMVVSKPIPRLLDSLNPFAYLLLYFSALLFLYFVYQYYFGEASERLRFTLKSRIQLTILLVLLISLLMVGLGINDYINTTFNRKNRLTIEEKMNSIVSELKMEVENRPGILQNREELNFLLTRYSGIFFSDINLFMPSGILLASSREAMYNEGLIGRQMHPQAYQALIQEQQPRFLHKEWVGNFEYLSGYTVFRNRNGEVLGYLNLPYFLRQKDLKEELSSSLLALINIYSLLIVASMLISLLIANQLTGPLSLLQQKLGKIRLGRKNETIEYRGNDEVASLVNEYNRMVQELEASAQLLAASERENAWKEMARQVAHEVKNPLTPMKLNVQYLLKAWEDGRTDFPERILRFKEAMLEQIETLSSIASEFSYFAKLPEISLQTLNLSQSLKSVMDFYSKNEEGVKLIWNPDSMQNAEVLADGDQLLRVFNNLFRNAIQAIPEGRSGEIQIHLFQNGSNAIVEIRDNGMGIPEQNRERIFTPNFTTKGSGMGLGLAMAKTIVENMKGEINFTSETGVGTSFYVKLPLLHTTQD
ncbi:MAG: HAMP domain-containing histidine kinase [Bacteroidetes bacterium]|nr:HAMP domain-containing histidine kinase [Bacteroidota bacterium]